MKQFMEVKSQIASMMELIKQKDNLILENNQKLNQHPINNIYNNNQVQSNNPLMNQLNPQQQNQFINNPLNNINQIGGLNDYMQYSGTNPFAMQQQNKYSSNSLIGANNQFINNNNLHR